MNGLLLHRVLASDAPPATLLIRLLVGLVFLSEGIQKFLFSGDLGVGRFTKIGLPSPEILAPFVGMVEIGAGALVLLGLFTRPASLALVFIMLVAIASTKVPIFLREGFWKMAHESRTDWSMLLGSLFLLRVGAGPWSLDARLTRAAVPPGSGNGGGSE
jgi:Predicted membrane protein